MNSAVKKILLAAGTVLLVGAVGIAQTDASSTSAKAKKKRSTYSSTRSAQNSSTSNAPSSSNPSSASSSAGTSQSGSTLPQSDSTSTATPSQTPATDGGSSATVKAGNSGFDDTSSSQNGTTGATPSSTASTSSSNSYASNSGVSGQASSAQTGSEASSSNDIINGPVAETVSDSSALIGWSTRNAASNTGIKYSTNRANLSQTAQGTDGADGKNHHAKLDGLSANTRYYFQVTENGQPVGGVGTFRTTAAGEQPVQSKAVIPQK